MRTDRTAGLVVAGIMTMIPALAQAQSLGLATSNPGSLYHSSGTAIAKLANDSGLRLTVQPYASPNVYLPAINNGDIPLGLCNARELTLAVTGQAYFKGRAMPNLRAVAIMYPLRVAIFVRKDSPIKTIADLKGKRLPSGWTSQKIIRPLMAAEFATAGMSYKDVRRVPVPNVVAGANAFMQGKTDAFFFALGTAKVREADASVGGIRALSIPDTPAMLAAIHKHWPVGYLRLEKPGKANPGVTAPIHAIAYDGVVAASTKTPAAVVYKLVKAMHDGKKELAASFAVFNLFNPQRMNKNLGPVKWHAGAIKYYKEQGMWPPK